jgi:hypothetical protein
MFISYQTVRNTVVASGLAILGGGSYLFFSPRSTQRTVPTVPESRSSYSPSYDGGSARTQSTSQENATQRLPEATVSVPPAKGSVEKESSPIAKNGSQSPTGSIQSLIGSEAKPPQNSVDSAAMLRSAMKIANEKATPNGGKDILGSKSPWKLNLYDDDSDGQWDRAKLDTNRDDVDDEKWTFKSGRWEKEGGNEIWNGERWQVAESNAGSSPKVSSSKSPMADDPLSQYQAAMKIAGAKATGAQGKDVLGAQSKWKLNLYDDDGDGQWDRGKLDTNRDGVDDEKWNFKKGRWEKEGGAKVWNGTSWTDP